MHERPVHLFASTQDLRLPSLVERRTRREARAPALPAPPARRTGRLARRIDRRHPPVRHVARHAVRPKVPTGSSAPGLTRCRSIVIIVGTEPHYSAYATMLYNDLAIFVRVARTGGFKAAASTLGLPASRVSRRIAELETRLGHRLFERTTRSVRLTEEGQALLDRCDGPVEALDGALGMAARPGGRIRVTAPPLAARRVIGEDLLAFLAARPDVSVELIATTEMLDFVRDGVDVAFRLGPLTDAEFVSRRLCPVPYTLCASDGFLAANPAARSISAGALRDLPLVFTGQVWLFRDNLSMRPRPEDHVFTDLEVARSAVAAGLGIGFLPLLMTGEDVVPLDVPGLVPVERALFIVHPSRRLLPERVRALIEWMVARTAGRA